MKLFELFKASYKFGGTSGIIANRYRMNIMEKGDSSIFMMAKERRVSRAEFKDLPRYHHSNDPHRWPSFSLLQALLSVSSTQLN